MGVELTDYQKNKQKMQSQPPTPEMLNILQQELAKQEKNKIQFTEILPKPHFILKLKTLDNQKIFANICSHEKVPPPKPKTEQEMFQMMQKIVNGDDDSMMDYKVPASLGEPHIET